jgi:hypothetical protein
MVTVALTITEGPAHAIFGRLAAELAP